MIDFLNLKSYLNFTVKIILPFVITAIIGSQTSCSSDINGDDQGKQVACVENSELAPINASSASALTQEPASTENIGSHNKFFGTGADPGVITLGPVEWRPEAQPYPQKNSMEFEIGSDQLVLAPIDMKFIGFANRNAQKRIYDDGSSDAPFHDLELCFESISSEWPEMVICAYHLSSSVLIPNYGKDLCTEQVLWGERNQRLGRLLDELEDNIYPDIGDAASCGANLGLTVSRGGIIGRSGTVGDHGFASFRFKVRSNTINPLTTCGDNSLHFVQPGAFFYWTCVENLQANQLGVLTYPFECKKFESNL
ncbi:MAG: hypothetical protein ACOH5I_25255 [Oligoflexus sp.]